MPPMIIGSSCHYAFNLLQESLHYLQLIKFSTTLRHPATRTKHAMLMVYFIYSKPPAPKVWRRVPRPSPRGGGWAWGDTGGNCQFRPKRRGTSPSPSTTRSLTPPTPTTLTCPREHDWLHCEYNPSSVLNLRVKAKQPIVAHSHGHY